MDQGEPDNDKWLRRLQAGEEEAWQDLHDRFSDRLWRVICKVGGFRPGEEDQVADIRQETFMAAVRSIRRFRGEAKLETWLHRLAVNKTIDHLRHRSRHPSADADLDPPEVNPRAPVDEDTALDYLLRQELYARLHDCLDRLRLQNERWWAIVTMHHFGDLLYRDIARELNLPLGTVQAALHRARLVLAHCVDGNKNGSSDDQRTMYGEPRP